MIDWRALITRWAEVAVAAALTLGLAIESLRWFVAGSGYGWAWAGLACVVGFWLRAALLGALRAPRTDMPGPGLVELREGEIGYLGPFRGGYLDLDAIQRVEVFVPTPGSEPVWRLVGVAGDLVIPSGAAGAAGLTQTLAQLPGFSDLTATAVLRQRAPGRQTIWQRDTPGLHAPGPRRLS